METIGKEMDRRQFGMGLVAGGLFLSGAAPSPATGRVRSPRWDAAGLEAVRRSARELGVRALVVTTGDETILAEGEVAQPSVIASVRKSFISALYGMAVAEGKIDLDTNLAALGIDDYIPLTDFERKATIRHLLQARSGIYIPSSAETPAMKAKRPPRGSHAPGSFWYYNNWDFNVLGEIYQRSTGEGVFTAMEHRIAKPLGFQDFDPLKHTLWQYDPDAPRFPAYHIFLSARDMARFGQLYLNRGRVKDTQIIPESWIIESTTPHSQTNEKGWNSGYGYLWWIASSRNGADPGGLPPGTYTAAGFGGRYITVFPDRNITVAVQPEEVRRGAMPKIGYADLLKQILVALE